MSDLRKIKRALISVSDKSGVLDLARGLASHAVTIISTGGTASALREAGIEVTEVSEITGFPEMMDGRVKTLHPKIHGGPERAVCLYSLEHILALQEEGHPIFPGAIGENLTLAGLDWQRMAVAVVLEIGDGEGPVLQLTQPVTPCNTIAAAFQGRAFRRVDETRRPGWARWYARVIRDGAIRPGDPVAFVG